MTTPDISILEGEPVIARHNDRTELGVLWITQHGYLIVSHTPGIRPMVVGLDAAVHVVDMVAHNATTCDGKSINFSLVFVDNEQQHVTIQVYDGSACVIDRPDNVEVEFITD